MAIATITSQFSTLLYRSEKSRERENIALFCSLVFLAAMEQKLTNLGSSLPVPCVQELAKDPLTMVPPRYVRVDQDPPVVSNTSSLPQVPVIDMQSLLSKDLIVMDTELEKLHHACKHWGFFQVQAYIYIYVSPTNGIGRYYFFPSFFNKICDRFYSYICLRSIYISN